MYTNSTYNDVSERDNPVTARFYWHEGILLRSTTNIYRNTLNATSEKIETSSDAILGSLTFLEYACFDFLTRISVSPQIS